MIKSDTAKAGLAQRDLIDPTATAIGSNTHGATKKRRLEASSPVTAISRSRTAPYIKNRREGPRSFMKPNKMKKNTASPAGTLSCQCHGATDSLTNRV